MVIRVPDSVSPRALDMVILFLEGDLGAGVIPAMTNKEVWEIRDAARDLEVPDLKDICDNILGDRVIKLKKKPFDSNPNRS